MSFVRPLALKLAAALLAPAAIAWFVATHCYPCDEAQRTTAAALAGGALLAVSAVLALALRAFAAPLTSALAARDAPPSETERQRAAASAMHLPSRVAATLLVASLAAMALLAAQMPLATGLDLAIAVAAVALALALMAAMLGYSIAARGTASALAALGPVELATSRTLRGKVAIVCSGLLAITSLLVGGAGYARYRADTERHQLAAVGEALDRAVASAGERGPAAVAEAARVATGAEIAAVAANGDVLGRAAAALPAGVEAAALAVPGVAPAAGGWRLWRPLPRGGTVAAFVSDAPLRARRAEFWGDLLVLAIGLLGASGLLVVMAARGLTFSVSSLGQAADRIASGDLTVSPPSLSRDELGQLAGHFRRMSQGLAALVTDVQAASRGVHDASREMEAIGARVKNGAKEEHERVRAVQGAVEAMQGSVATVAGGVDTVAEYVHTTSAALGALAAALEDVRREARDLEGRTASAGADFDKVAEAGRRAQTQLGALDDLAMSAQGTLASVSASLTGLETSAVASQLAAAQAAELAERAGDVVQETVAGVDGLRSAVGDAKRRVAVLGRRSDDIDHILDFIGEVAGRTNLLSLNASIIATQAGEHGKAFAVVADQIRELAAQISSSTKSIGEIIRAVRDDVSGTARLIDRGDALATDGVASARKSLQALHEIRGATARGHEAASSFREAVQAHASATRDVAGLVGSVAESSRSLSEAIQMVSKSVAAVSSVSRGVGGLADQVSRALEEQSGAGRRQLETLERMDGILVDITHGVEDHGAATRSVCDALAHLGRTAEQQDGAVVELSAVAERLGGRSRALAERVARFKLDLQG
jgi:methyl-accepting chemotaxis protein